MGVFSISACTPSPAQTSPTNSPQVITTRLTALLLGQLVLDGNCLRVKSDNGASILAVAERCDVEREEGRV